MYRTASGALSSDNGNNRHMGYTGYLAPQTGAGPHHDASQQGHNMGHGSDGLGAVMNQFSSLALPSGPAMSPGSQVQAHHAYCASQDPSMAYQGFHMPLVGMSPEGQYPYALSGQYPLQAGFAPMPVPYHSVPYTPGRMPSFHERYSDRYTDRYTERSSGDVPALENRRGSYSTTESTPATPFFGSASERAANARAPVIPSSYTTPSPEQVVAQAPKPQILDQELVDLLKQEPIIPDAVPAVFTPPTHMKSIEQCLENRISGNRNVYIRGLHPTTDDELLLQYASRFGKVEQSKAIIDTATGACKGYVHEPVAVVYF